MSKKEMMLIKPYDKIKEMISSLQPYQFEPERKVSNKHESEEECFVKKYLNGDNGTRVRNLS